MHRLIIPNLQAEPGPKHRWCDLRRTLRQEKEIAWERIQKLITMAHAKWGQDPALSQRYIEIARRIGMRCNIRLPPGLKRYICKRCNSPLIPGVSCRVRIRPEEGTKLVMTCLECGGVKRYPGLKRREKEGAGLKRALHAHKLAAVKKAGAAQAGNNLGGDASNHPDSRFER